MPSVTDPRPVLERIYRTAAIATRPGTAVATALRRLDAGASPLGDARTHVLAMGKAAEPMARAALAWCRERGAPVVGGVCVPHVPIAEPGALAPLVVVPGDHPIPAAASFAAADRLGEAVAAVAPGDHAIVLVSGGTSALIGAPLPGLAPAAITALGDALLHAGLPIDAINRVRRRVHRWGGGRLAAALLDAGARITVLLASDVIGDTVPSIGSGPCAIAPVDDDEVLALLRDLRGVPPDVCAWIAADAPEGRMPAVEVPSGRLRQEIVTSAAALAAAAEDESWRLGLHGDTAVGHLAGDAHDEGAAFATAMLASRARRRARGTKPAPVLRIAVGEPVVHVPDPARALGGRMQAFALAAARVLHDAGDAAEGLHILAAGSDGRDGPTDAAGAIVDRWTWSRARELGHHGATCLSERRSYVALDAVGATIRAWETGTNVNDLVLGLDLPVR